MSEQGSSNERASISAGASELMMELFNRMPIESLKSVPEPIAKRIGDFMVANGYRIVFDRWHLQAEPRPAPETSGLQQIQEIARREAMERWGPPLKASGCPTHGTEHFFEGMCIKCGIVPPVSEGEK